MEPNLLFRVLFVCVLKSPLFLPNSRSTIQTHRFSPLLPTVLLWANYHKNDPPIVEVSFLDRPALGALISPVSRRLSRCSLSKANRQVRPTSLQGVQWPENNRLNELLLELGEVVGLENIPPGPKEELPDEIIDDEDEEKRGSST